MNSILLFLIKDNINYKLTIHGSFWGYGESDVKLVDNVFKGVKNKNISIQLLNPYGSLNNNRRKDLEKCFKNRKFNNVSSSATESDHSKTVTLYANNNLIFWMVGSTNFSWNSYHKINGKDKIDQAETAFIKLNSFTENLIYLAMNSELSSELLRNFVDLLGLKSNEDYDSHLVNLMKSIMTFPYIGVK